MNNRRAGRLLTLAASLLAFTAAAPAVLAQDAVISGKVTGPGGQPIEGANIGITSMAVGAATTTAGTYSFRVKASDAVGQTVTVVARRIGFSPVSKQVTLTPGEHTIDFELEQDVRRLDEIVVTGLAKATSIKNTTISIGKISEDQLDKVPAPSIGSALAAKVSGVAVQMTSGMPGETPSVRVRGSTNLQLGNNDPLYVIDGVIARNGLADIDPQDIVSVEVLKGAASANTYGSQAANGVVAITTRRGESVPDGEFTITTRNEFGRNSLERWVPLNRSHLWELNNDGSIAVSASGTRIVKTDGIMDNPYPTTGPNAWRNQLKTWLSPKTTQNNYVGVGYRKGNTNFFTSLSRNTDPGVLPLLNGFERKNLRFNVDQIVNEKIDVSGSLLYGTDDNDNNSLNPFFWSGGVQGSGGTFFGLLQAAPDVDLEYPYGAADRTRFNNALGPIYDPQSRGNPLYDLDNINFNDHRNRLFGAMTVRYRPTGWLSFDASYGTDRFNRRQSYLQPRGYISTDSSVQFGSMRERADEDNASNSQINATAVYGISGLSATTRLTYLHEEQQRNWVITNGGRLNVGNTPVFGVVDPTTLSATSWRETIRSINYFVTQDLNYSDRYLAQFLLRRDGSSLFGPEARWHNYYGISGAWRVTQDFEIPGFQELKLRAAVGTAGLRPGFDYQYESLAPVGGNLSFTDLGNMNLQPAKQKETEFAINASFLDRFDAEVVTSRRRTVSGFMNVPQSIARGGGFERQWLNVSTISGRTLELALTTRVIQGPNLTYSFTLTGDRTRQHIDKLGAPSFKVGGNDVSQSQDVFYYREGENLGVVYGDRWARSVAELLDDPANAGKSLADLEAVYSVNSDGYVVETATIGTQGERAIKYVDPSGESYVKIGDANPDFNFGWANTLTYKGFTVYALVQGSRGGQVYNFTKQWMYQDQRHGDFDQSGKPDSEKKAADYYTVGFYNALKPNSHFVEDGSFVKLRELSVAYQLSKGTLQSIGLSNLVRSMKVALIGRNLKTWTKYSGFDPEAGALGDANLRIDGFRYPTFRQISGQIEIGF